MKVHGFSRINTDKRLNHRENGERKKILANDAMNKIKNDIEIEERKC